MHARICLLLLVCLLIATGCTKSKSTDELLVDLKEGKGTSRTAAARLLLDRQGDAAKVVPALIESLSDKNDNVRVSAAIGLGFFGKEAKAAIPKLQEALKDHDLAVRRAANNSLARIDPSLAAKPAPAASAK